MSDQLEFLYRKNHERVFRAAFRITGDAMDAEDVLQTVFMRLLRREGDFALTGDAGPYLHRAAINAAFDLLRRRRRNPASADAGEMSETLPDPAADPWSSTDRESLRRALRDALGRLTDAAAEVFALRYFEDYANHEIAELLGMTPTAVAVTLHRSRARVREELVRAQEMGR
ncbi:MAG: sigma-70 family RNA polymerase sigma factor [Acidobacteriota bacterium]